MEKKKRKFCDLNECRFQKQQIRNIKHLGSILICDCCKGTFCSEECKMEHRIQINYRIFTKPINSKSIFIKKGYISNEKNKNSYFSFENFEKVKIQNRVKILGNGAFGNVYLIKNKIDGKLFALKQLDRIRMSSVGVKEDVIYREIKIHLGLIHDNIARLYSYHEDSKAFYLIMEYVENGTLFSVIQSSGGLKEDDAFRYFIQVASAIYFLHENKLIHRDLKPENCLIDKEGNVKLCDFGWAVETSNEGRGTFCGTYEYMAPEIIKETPYSKSIDIWSLGVLLYELIHSYSPFRINKNKKQSAEPIDPTVEILKNILNHKFKIEKEVSDDCKDILNRLLNPECEHRIVIEDVFVHNWVSKYENRLKVCLEEELKNHVKKSVNVKVKQRRTNSYDSNNETMIKEFTGKGDLFDDILDQLKSKNKNQRTSKSLVKYRFSLENINKTIEEERKILSKKPYLPSPIKSKEDDYSNFSMYKEMKEIDRQIDQNNRMYENYNNQKDRIKYNLQNINYDNAEFNKFKANSLISIMDAEKTLPQSDYQPSITRQKTKTDKFSTNIMSTNEDFMKSSPFDPKPIRNSRSEFTKEKSIRQRNKKETKRSRIKYDPDLLEDTYENPFNFEKLRSETSVQTENPKDGFWDKFWGYFNVKCG